MTPVFLRLLPVILVLLWTGASAAEPVYGPALAPAPEEEEGGQDEEAGEEGEGEAWEMSEEELAGILTQGPEAAEETEEEEASAPSKSWKDKLDIRGYFDSDLRSTLPGKDVPGLLDDFTFIRSENTFMLRGEIQVSPKTKAVGQMELIFTGMAVGDEFSDLTLRQKIDPFRFESDALYVQIMNLAPGLDLRIGRQVIVWGTADKMSPTNNLNALDLEDPLLFGEAIANEMILLEYSPWFVWEGKRTTILEEMTISLVYIPIFRPAQLPFWTVEAMQAPALFRQQVHAEQMFHLLDLQDVFSSKGGELDWDIRYRRPSLAAANMQGAAKLSWIFLGIDMSVSYFNGFDDMPRAERVYANDIYLTGPMPPLGDGMLEILEGMDDLTGATVKNDVVLTYPRMQVLGFDFSTSLDFLGGLGLWGEVAFFFNYDLTTQVRTSGAWFDFMGNGYYAEIPGIERNYVLKDYRKGWFWKGTFGVDYSFTSWWYLNVQYIHGFIDEFGEVNLKDYIMAGMDFRLLDTKLIIRLFSVVSFPFEQMCRADGGICKRGASAVLYPEITMNFWRGTELSLGSLVYVGRFDTKFGSPLAGPSTLFLRGRISI